MSEYQKLIKNPADHIDLCVEVTAVRVAELIAKEIERRGLSRVEFGRMMEVTPGRVTQILDPDSNPQLRTVARALAVLGLVMNVEAVPLESLACTDKWIEASELPATIMQPHPTRSADSARTKTDLAASTYSLAA